MLKTRKLHLVKFDFPWNAKKPWCNYYWADNETPQHSYPAFCELGHATDVYAKDLDVHVTCDACSETNPDFPGIMIGLSGMVKDVQFDDDKASQYVLRTLRYDKYFLFTDNLGWLDSLIKERDSKTKQANGGHKMTNATTKETLLSLLCCHADLCRMEGQTKDREHDIVASVARAVSSAIVDLTDPEEEEEPNLTYALKEMLRRQISVHEQCKAQGGSKNHICDYCPMAEYCDSTVHEVCLNLQKEYTK